MKMLKRVISATLLAILAVLLSVTVVLAVGDISDLVGNPTNTSIILTWVRASSANTTVIQYRTDTYPTTPNDGTNTYNGTGFQCTVSGLVAGQIYYFSAWGQSGGTYSTTVAHLAMSTLATSILSGNTSGNKVTLPTPTVSANMNQNPDSSSFNLEPFTSIISYFNTGTGGLGMPVNNVWEVIFVGFVVVGGVATYTKIRNFFVAFSVVFVLTIFGVGLHLMQGWLVGVEIFIGMGVWAIERYLQ